MIDVVERIKALPTVEPLRAFIQQIEDAHRARLAARLKRSKTICIFSKGPSHEARSFGPEWDDSGVSDCPPKHPSRPIQRLQHDNMRPGSRRSPRRSTWKDDARLDRGQCSQQGPREPQWINGKQKEFGRPPPLERDPNRRMTLQYKPLPPRPISRSQTYTIDGGTLEATMRSLRSKFPFKTLVVGVDLEFLKPRGTELDECFTRQAHRPALLQIATPERALLVRLMQPPPRTFTETNDAQYLYQAFKTRATKHASGHFYPVLHSPVLLSFLFDREIKKIGKGIKHDEDALAAYFGTGPKVLRDLETHYGQNYNRLPKELQSLYDQFKAWKKESNGVTMSDWSKGLSPVQIRYAAMDAMVPCFLASSVEPGAMPRPQDPVHLESFAARQRRKRLGRFAVQKTVTDELLPPKTKNQPSSTAWRR